MSLKIIKSIRSAESKISMVLGIVVVIAVGVLLFNYFKGVSKTTSLSEETPESENQIQSEAEKKLEKYTGSLPTKHTVQKGENLWKISVKYFGNGYNWPEIAKENKLKNSGIILVGQELSIPNVPVKKPLNQTVKSPSLSGEPISGNSYTVVKGDNLWNISVRAYQDGFKWLEIAKANNLTNPNVIHPGNTLVIPR